MTLFLSASPVIGLSTASLTFNAPFGGPNPAAQNVTVTNVGGETLNWSANDGGAAWLSQVPASGPLTAGQSTGMSVAVNVAGLAAGPYSATITVSGGMGVTSKTIAVSLNVSALPAISLSTSSLTFDVPFGWPDPISQTVNVTNAGGGTLNWSADDAGTPWLGQSPPSGSLGPGLSQTMSVTVVPAALAEGGHSATVTVSAPSIASKTVSVSVNVTAAPRIGLNPGSLLFDVSSGGGVSAAQALSVTNSGGGTLDWTASADVPWILLSPTSGSLGAVTSEPLSVSVDPSALAEGIYSGTILVSASGASNTPQLVGVTAQVGPAPVVVPAEHVAAGQCGSVGLDLAAPLAFLWWIRRRRKGAHGTIREGVVGPRKGVRS
ncbi:MAG: BACON domain-containing protein [Actinomycetota bacterium]